MTMPIVLPRVVADPTMAVAPNAGTPDAVQSPHDAEGSVDARFGAALTLLLAHAGVNAGTATGEPVDATADAGSDAPDERHISHWPPR